MLTQVVETRTPVTATPALVKFFASLVGEVDGEFTFTVEVVEIQDSYMGLEDKQRIEAAVEEQFPGLAVMEFWRCRRDSLL
jgi:hypothetical protein